MKTLSFTQEYFLCALSKNKGKVSLMDSDAMACLLAGGIMELLRSEYISIAEKNKIAAAKPWDGSLPWLKPLYDEIIAMKKPGGVKEVANIYLGSGKAFKGLIESFGAGLVELGYADELTKDGLFTNKIKYVPKADAVERIVEKVRSEFLEAGTMTEEILCLAALLDKGGLIRNYFSKFEADKFKERLKEVRSSEEYAPVKEVFDYINEIIAVVVIICSIVT